MEERRRRRWPWLLLAASIVVAIVLASISINESGDDETPDVEAAPEAPELTAVEAGVADAIAIAAETRSADDCADLASPAYLQQREHLPRGRALGACQTDVFEEDEGLLDEPMQVIAVEGAESRAPLALVRHQAGSDWAGLTARIRMAGGKLAGIEGFHEAERSDLEHAVRLALIEGPPVLPKGVADCAVASLRARPPSELEAMLLSPSAEPLYAPALACDRAAVVAPEVRALRARWDFVPAVGVACAASRLQGLPDTELVQVVVGRDEGPALAAALACARVAILRGYARGLGSGPYKLPRRARPCVLRRLSAKSTAELVAVFTSKGTDEISAACGFKLPQG